MGKASVAELKEILAGALPAFLDEKQQSKNNMWFVEGR